jgi:3-phosphoshikimate 1-carboxyvinyltransferase
MGTSDGPSYRVGPPSHIGGSISVPGDKSISHRALMLGAIADGRTEVEGFLDSEDCRATEAALRGLGVAIERAGDSRLEIEGSGVDGLAAASGPLDMGNAGTAMRLMMGLLAGQRFESVLVGDESLSRRPMERAAAPLRRMGARIDTTAGHAPVTVHGAPLTAADHTLEVPSAQVKSALLLAGLYARGTTRISEPAVTRDHTERMLRAFGVEVTDDRGTVAITGGQRLTACPIRVPGDLSSAAFFLVLGALAADRGLIIRNVGINPTRSGVLDILSRMGAQISVRPRVDSGAEPTADLEVYKSELSGIEVPPDLVPLAIDEFPVLFIAAAAARGATVVTGAAELRVKESDRIAAMADGLARLGIDVKPRPDGLVIQGGSMHGGSVDSRGDHRVAMAFAVAGSVASGPIVIRDVENVATSFPDFPGTAARVGLAVEQIP